MDLQEGLMGVLSFCFAMTLCRAGMDMRQGGLCLGLFLCRCGGWKVKSIKIISHSV